jgi:radical SAM protein with 4Fe4S-binding SPASM domain
MVTYIISDLMNTGGEPLLFKGWDRIASRLNELGISTKILTHGGDLEANTVSALKESGISGIGVSINGTEDIHDGIRNRKGLFQRAIYNISKLVEAGIPVTVVTAANARNVGALPSLMEQLSEIGIARWQIQPVFPTGRVKACSDLIMSEKKYLELGEFITCNYPKAGKKIGFDILIGDSYGYFTDLDPREKGWHGCPAGLFSCGITSDGKVKGCLSMPDELVEGDLKKDSLWDIWFKSNAFSYTRSYSEANLGPNCQGCYNSAQCRGGCSTMSYCATGKFHNDPYCFYGLKHMHGKRSALIEESS